MSTEQIQRRMLQAIHPGHDAEPPVKWQQRKSAQTRQKLVEAGIDCLVEGGYAGLTTAAVAERCHVSRGAMHHHFATRMELVAAVVDYVFYRRLRDFLADYFADLKERGAAQRLITATEMHWKSVQSRDYAAYIELAVAARTDPELDTVFTPAAKRYDEVWTSEMIEAFPQWSAHWDGLKLANDFVTAAHMGMLLRQPTLGDGERMERLKALIARVVQELHATA